MGAWVRRGKHWKKSDGRKMHENPRFFGIKIAKITKIAKIAKMAEIAENAKVAKEKSFHFGIILGPFSTILGPF